MSASVVILTNEFCDILKFFFFLSETVMWLSGSRETFGERLMGKSAYGNEQTRN